MIQATRQVLGVAAVALVEPHDVPATGPRLVGHSAHVVRKAGALETMQQDVGRMLRGTVMPMTMCEHTSIGGDVEVASDRGGEPRKCPRFAPGIEGLKMASGESRLELGLGEGHSNVSGRSPRLRDAHI